MEKVSVIIPYYNNEETIRRALASAASQTYENIEIILIDDGSIDDSHKKADALILENDLKNCTHIKQENSGPSRARNKGIDLSSGEYIAFLDADDEWLPNKLEKQIKTMQSLKAELLGCSYNLIIGQRIQEFKFTNEVIKKVSFKEALFKHYFATPCIVAKRDVILKAGGFPENQNYMEDSYLFTKIARDYNAFISSECLVNIYKMPYGESGLSSRLKEMEVWEIANLNNLRNEDKAAEEKTGFLLFLLAISFSYLKYIRRRMITFLRKRV